MKIRENIKNLKAIMDDNNWVDRKDEIIDEINEIDAIIDECESKNDDIVHSADKLRDILY